MPRRFFFTDTAEAFGPRTAEGVYVRDFLRLEPRRAEALVSRRTASRV
ncbi:MAG: hypothetical protein GX929_02820 [Clostridiales bacterium]|nr:hypothetical protein [Clostridiales bacterium]